MGWMLFYMLVILKIPVIAALYLVWYAVRAEPEPADEERREWLHRPDDDRPRPHSPRPPRRGPHAEPQPPSPRRTRVIGKRVERTHG